MVRIRRRIGCFAAMWRGLTGGLVRSLPEDEVARSFRAAFEALPEIQRKIFRRHRLEGEALADIGIALGISSSVVERELAAALSTLAAKLAAI